jgi:hypothetical protein
MIVMRRRPAFVSALLSQVLLAMLFAAIVSEPALAALQAVEQAFELQLDQVTLPGRTGGSLLVRRCPDCAPVSLQVTPATACFVSPGRTAVSLQGLLDAIEATPRQEALISVFYDPATRRVTRLVLNRAP